MIQFLLLTVQRSQHLIKLPLTSSTTVRGQSDIVVMICLLVFVCLQYLYTLCFTFPRPIILRNDLIHRIDMKDNLLLLRIPRKVSLDASRNYGGFESLKSKVVEVLSKMNIFIQPFRSIDWVDIFGSIIGYFGKIMLMKYKF